MTARSVHECNYLVCVSLPVNKENCCMGEISTLELRLYVSFTDSGLQNVGISIFTPNGFHLA